MKYVYLVEKREEDSYVLGVHSSFASAKEHYFTVKDDRLRREKLIWGDRVYAKTVGYWRVMGCLIGDELIYITRWPVCHTYKKGKPRATGKST